MPQVSSARRPGKLPFLLAPEDLAPWSPASLRDRLGPAPIPVEYGLAGIYRPRLALNAANYFRKTMPGDAAIERIWFSEHYATSHYVSALDLAELAPALAPSLPDLRNGSGADPARRLLFIGNATTGTHAHYDLFDVVVTVLAGRKRFQFFPPACRRRLKPYRSPLPCCNYSSRTDREVRDLFERTADPRVFDLTADAGEMVYIPSCWWHRVTNDGFTASLSSLWPPPTASRCRWAHLRVAAASTAAGRQIAAWLMADAAVPAPR